MLIIPAPEMVRVFEWVPVELMVVLPAADQVCAEVCTLAEIVMVLAACPIPIPAPADTDNVPEDPFRLFTTLAGALCTGAEIEMLLALIPILTAPIPEKASKLL